MSLYLGLMDVYKLSLLSGVLIFTSGLRIIFLFFHFKDGSVKYRLFYLSHLLHLQDTDHLAEREGTDQKKGKGKERAENE